VLKVHCQPGQNHHRHGVLRNAFGHARCRMGWLHTPNRQAVETKDRAGMATHVGLRIVGFLVDERKSLQKLVQCALATIKGLNGVRGGQFANGLRQPLFLAGIRLRQISSGKSLSDFVSDLRQSITANAEAERLLSERLIAAGFFAAHADLYPRRFEVTNARVVEVTEEFPKLTLGRVPQGISKAMYEIDLDRVPGVNFGTSEALKKLGVL